MRFIRRSITPSQVEVNFPVEPQVPSFIESKFIVENLQIGMRNRNESNSDGTCRFNQVTDYLFVGNIEAAYSEPLLCRYHIASLVDVSALHPNQVDRHRKSICPCTCPLQIAHSRAKLTVVIEEREAEEISPFLAQINKFIHSHRLQRRNVLVFSDAGLCRAPTIIAQYLIQYEDQHLPLIITNMASFLPGMAISPAFSKLLRKIERKAARKRTSSTFWHLLSVTNLTTVPNKWI